MNFETFISRLEEVKEIARIENAYSHIVYDIICNHVIGSDYMLVDVSTYARQYDGIDKNIELLGKDLCAVPDFVVTNKAKSLKDIERLGCIEVKLDASGLNTARLDSEGGKRGYLDTYNKNVIYTNGWIWKYYMGTKNSDGENVPEWTIDFTQEKQRNAVTYYELLMKLSDIKWKIEDGEE